MHNADCISNWANKQRTWIYPPSSLPRLTGLKINLDSADVQHLMSNASYWAYTTDANPSAINVLRNRRIEWQDALDSAVDALNTGAITKLYILNVTIANSLHWRSPSMVIFPDDHSSGALKGHLVNVSTKFLRTLVDAGAGVTVLTDTGTKTELSTLGAAAKLGEGKVVVLRDTLAVNIAIRFTTTFT
jgi:hypothetical protein